MYATDRRHNIYRQVMKYQLTKYLSCIYAFWCIDYVYFTNPIWLIISHENGFLWILIYTN